MSVLLRLLVAAIWAGWIGVTQAGQAAPTAEDPVAASRSAHLAEQFRCLVCQNQTIAESNADLALDLRRQIREQIAAGRSDEQIVEYMVARYGDFVLYRPPFRGTTILLWIGPALLLAGGAALLVRALRERRAAQPAAALTAEERERAAQLLATRNGEEIA